MATFGETIRQARANRKPYMTATTLAEKVGVTKMYVSDLELGKRLPGEDTCRQIAHVLNLNPDELLAKAGKAPPDLLEIIATKPNEARAALMALVHN